MPDDSLRSFKAAYLEKAKELKDKQNKEGDKADPEVQQLDFEFVLFASAVVDYDYIMGLIAKNTQKSPQKQKMTKEQIINLLSSNSNLMDAEEFTDGWDEEELQGIINSAYNNYIHEAGMWSNFINNVKYLSNNCLVLANEFDNDLAEGSPTIPIDLINKMPEVIKQMALLLSNARERDVFITGAISILSGCLYSARGIYDGDVIFPNLFSFIIAPAASGKGF